MDKQLAIAQYAILLLMALIQDSPRKTTQETPSIQSLDRGLVILETIGKSNSPVSLGHLTAILGIDRSSVFRLANTLSGAGSSPIQHGQKLHLGADGLAPVPSV